MRQAGRQEWRQQVVADKEPGLSISRDRKGGAPSIVAPENLRELQALLHPSSQRPLPIRPMGANSSATACTSAMGGTVIDMTAMKSITDLSDGTVTAQAGIELAELMEFLADKNLEIGAAIDLPSRTLGGAIASACFGPSLADDGAMLASQVESVKVVTPGGQVLVVDGTRGNLLNVFRMSEGMLGVIFEATLRVRPIRQFVVRQSKMDIATFGRSAGLLAQQDVGLKFFLMPFRDRVYSELRRRDAPQKKVRGLNWRVKDLGESTVLPAICGRLARIVPIPGVRYSLVDGINDVAQSLLARTAAEGGDAAIEQRSRSGRFAGPPLRYSTWCFPVENFAMLLAGYTDFAAQYYRRNKFRCDMPLVGFKVAADQSSILSPSFDGPMFALRAVSNPHPMWDDFVMDFAEFAQRWGGVPLFSQSRSAEVAYTGTAFGSRLEFFRKIRRQLDPDARMLNPFLAQYFT